MVIVTVARRAQPIALFKILFAHPEVAELTGRKIVISASRALPIASQPIQRGCGVDRIPDFDLVGNHLDFDLVVARCDVVGVVLRCGRCGVFGAVRSVLCGAVRCGAVRCDRCGLVG
jgi:hypothetical protein